VDFKLGAFVDFKLGALVDFKLGALVDFKLGALVDFKLGAFVDLGLDALSMKADASFLPFLPPFKPRASWSKFCRDRRLNCKR
jgi:hypothetical protein